MLQKTIREQQSINWRYNRIVKEGEKPDLDLNSVVWLYEGSSVKTLQKYWSETGVGGVLLNSFASLYTSYSYRHPFSPAHTVIAQFISMQTPPTVRLCLQLWLRWRLDHILWALNAEILLMPNLHKRLLNLVCVIYTGRPREGFTVGCVFIELQQTVSRKWKYKLYFILAKKKKNKTKLQYPRYITESETKAVAAATDIQPAHSHTPAVKPRVNWTFFDCTNI